MNELMTTKEVADYLRIKERKVYDLLAAGEIPSTRVTGKWLFPRHLIDIWIARSSTFPEIAADLARPAPPVVVGSHDPLLDWTVRASGCDLAMLPGGSLDGLDRFRRGEAVACGMHVLDPTSGDYNVPIVQQSTVGLDCVLIEWAWREQGLLLAAGNPLGVTGIGDLAERKARVVLRQAQAGSSILFQHLLSAAGLRVDGLNVVDVPARNETDLGLAIVEGKADAGLGVRSAARQLGLDFLPLHRERFDLLVRRRDYFRPPVQKLLAFARTAEFAARAADMAGYDVGELGAVVYNAP